MGTIPACDDPMPPGPEAKEFRTKACRACQGILSFFCLAALGQGLYLLLDMEENTRITAQALAQIARRQGT